MTISSIIYPVSVNENILGIIYGKNSWIDLSDFIVNGATSSIINNKIQISDTSSTLEFDKSLNLSPCSSLEYWKMIVSFKVLSAPSTTTFGIGIGMWPSIEGNSPCIGAIDLTTNSTAGKISQYGVNIPANTSSIESISFSQNDIINLTIERVRDYILVTAYNETTKSTLITTSSTFPTPIVNLSQLVPGNGRFSIFSLGGQYEIEAINVNSNEIVGADIMVIGDSKTVGYQTTNYTNRLASLLRRNFINTIVSAASGDTTSEILSRINEIISLRPKQIILSIGSNDFLGNNDYQNRYISIVNQLTIAGIPVWNVCYFETARDVTGLNTFINSTFPNTTIDTYTITQLNGAIYNDNIHLTDLGNYLVYSAILDSNKLRTNILARETNIGIPGQIGFFNNNNLLAGSSILTLDELNFLLSLNASIILKPITPSSTEDGQIWFDGSHFFGVVGTTPIQLDNSLPIISGSLSQVGVATTVFTVTIGSTLASNIYRVAVTPTSVLSAAVFYVTNKTTTTFDVTYLAGLTGTVTFDWEVFR